MTKGSWVVDPNIVPNVTSVLGELQVYIGLTAQRCYKSQHKQCQNWDIMSQRCHRVSDIARWHPSCRGETFLPALRRGWPRNPSPLLKHLRAQQTQAYPESLR